MREPDVQSANLHHQAVSHQNISVGDKLCTFSDSGRIMITSLPLQVRCVDVVTEAEMHTV